MEVSIYLSIKLRGHIQLLGPVGNPKKIKWFWNRTKPAKQISIPKSLTLVFCFFHRKCLVAFSVGEEGLKWSIQHRLCFFRGFTWTGHFIDTFSVGGGCIKWPAQHRLCFFRNFTCIGHFIEAFFVGKGDIKWSIQHRLCFFRWFYLDWPFYRGILCGGRGYKVVRPI